MRNPIQHTESFNVRHYECDAFGRLSNAVYFRYMQEAGIGASTALGFDDEKYRAINRAWLPRITEIDFHQPIGLGERIEVLTWVDSARRVQSRRMYEFRKKGEDKLCAIAHTDWVFIDRNKGIPVTIPTEIMSKFIPKATSIARQRFPKVPEPPHAIFKLKRPVEWRDVDPMRHLNNAAYIDYAEDCTARISTAYGLDLRKMNLEFSAQHTLIEYLIPAEVDVELEISTWLTNLEPMELSRYYSFQNADSGELLARMLTKWMTIDRESGTAVSIPTAIIEALTPNSA